MKSSKFALTEAIFLLLIADLVLLGPVGFVVSGLPIRQILYFILIFVFFVEIIWFSEPIPDKILIFSASLLLFIIVFGFVAPVANSGDLGFALAELRPLFYLFSSLPIYYILKYRGWERAQRVFILASLVVLFVVISVGILSFLSGSRVYSDYLERLLKYISGSDVGIYVGPMPDGSIRIMWLQVLVFPILFFYFNLKKLRYLISFFILAGVIFTGTRGLLLGVVFPLFILFYNKITLKLAASIIGIGVLGSFFLTQRFIDIGSEFSEDSVRVSQILSLFRLIAEYPFLGSGFGGFADLIRSDTAPFSYEVALLAFVAKVGIFAFAIIGLSFIYVSIRIRRVNDDAFRLLLASVSCVLVLSLTNPFLFTSLSMVIFAVYIACFFYMTDKSSFR